MYQGRAPAVVASACRLWLVRGCCSGMSGLSGTSGPVWVIGPISIWVVRDVLFVAGFVSLLPLSPLLVATTGRFCWLPVSASSKFGFPCQVQVQVQVEVQNAHARLLLARQVRWVGGCGMREDDGICKTPAHETQLQQATTRILLKTEALDLISCPATPQEGGSVNLRPSSASSRANEGRWLQNGRCRIRKASRSSPAPATPLQGREKRGSVG